MTGCDFFKANKINNPNSKKIQSAASVGLKPLGDSNNSNYGVVRYSLLKQNNDDQWVYWTAGSSQVVRNPDPSYISSNSWDLRLTTFFPLVASNGGATAQHFKNPDGQAGFSFIDQASQPLPQHRDQVLGLNYVLDRYEALEYNGSELAPEWQNPLVNQIETGLLKSYNPANHHVELSYRVFVLKTADGLNYYLIRFSGYSRKEKWFEFEWLKLE